MQSRCLSESGKCVSPEKWLLDAVDEFENEEDSQVNLPVKSDGTPYKICDLFPDQQQIVVDVMSKIHEWLTTDDLSNFEPLRITIIGKGGCGKSVVVNTIISIMRSMFNCNDVIGVMAPSGAAAFNVNGETLHHFTGSGVTNAEYKPNSMSVEKRKRLVRKFRNLLAIILDERSLVPSVDLGTVEQHVKETIYGGGHINKEWGGVPVLILAGDDYQLPVVKREGAFDALESCKGGPMTQLGRLSFRKCAERVYELNNSRRINNNSKTDIELMDRVRIGTDLRENDIRRLLALDLKAIKVKHGAAVVDDIQSRAIHLFYSNAKRLEFNMHKLRQVSSPENPVAFIETKCDGPNTQSKSSHFGNNKQPPTCMINVGTKVAIEGKNFVPQWGLHNGACGTVMEITFKPGQNPNNGDHPAYVVVNFPKCCGPSKW